MVTDFSADIALFAFRSNCWADGSFAVESSEQPVKAAPAATDARTALRAAEVGGMVPSQVMSRSSYRTARRRNLSREERPGDGQDPVDRCQLPGDA
jgi:hypothetical protein